MVDQSSPLGGGYYCSGYYIGISDGGVVIYGVAEQDHVASDYSFVDGNKRIGMHIMLTFLSVNGLPVECSNDDVVRIGLGVADGSIGYEELLEWVRDHVRR